MDRQSLQEQLFSFYCVTNKGLYQQVKLNIDVDKWSAGTEFPEAKFDANNSLLSLYDGEAWYEYDLLVSPIIKI
jgi:hypothetical protein